MATKIMLLAAALCAVALSGCTAGDDSGDGSDGDTTTTGGAGVGGNVTVGNSTVSGSFTATGTSGNTTGNGTGTDAPLTASVSIEGGQFVNQSVTIRVGGTVTWTHNDGTASHTVTADDGSFDSNPNCSPTVPPLPPTGDCLTQGETYSYTFDTAGSYGYHSKATPTATGTVMVVEA